MRIALALLLLLIAAPAAPAAIISFQSGDTPITGSDQHLPPLAVTSPYTAPPAIGASIVQFRESGGYTADIRGTVAAARTYLDHWLATQCHEQVRDCRAMIVSDIDDTIVSWYSFYASPAVGWQYLPSLEAVAMADCSTPPIRQTIAFLKEAQSRGVTLALITGRKSPSRAVTASCLAKVGITGEHYLILRSPSEYTMTAAEYKANRRRILERAGWRIALSIGDQVSDMAGGYTDAGFLVPNPMYFIP